MFNTIFKILWRKIQALSSLFTAWHQHMRGGLQSVRRLLLCLLVVYCLSGVAMAKEQPSEIAFNIPRQRADLSLISFAEQADITLLFPLDQMEGKQTNVRSVDCVGLLLVESSWVRVHVFDVEGGNQLFHREDVLVGAETPSEQ